MAYQIGTASSPNDLLDQLRIFMVAQGWTQSYWAAEGTGMRLHLSKGGWYFNARSSPDASAVWATSYVPQVPQLGFNLSTGLSTSNAWRDQAGAVRDVGGVAIGSGIPLPSGAIQGYVFLYDPATDSLIAYIQTAVGLWRWFGFGLAMIQQGTWSGGQWLASCANYYYLSQTSGPGQNNSLQSYPFGANRDYFGGPLVFVNLTGVDGYTGWLSAGGAAQTGKLGYTNVPGGAVPSTMCSGLQNILDRAGNTLNSLDVLLPIQIFSTLVAGGVVLLGRLPNVYATNPSGLVAGQAYALGTDFYVTFPSYTATRGTAVKKV